MQTSTVQPVFSSTAPELPHTWTKLRYHPTQAALWDCAIHRKKRYIAVVAGRGSGKTELAKRFIVLNLALQSDFDAPPMYAYCLPTFAQAKKVAWYPILSLIPKTWIRHSNDINKTESSITTVFGSTLYVVGMDKPHRLEGLQLNGCILDESSDHRPGVFQRTIVPMLTHRNAWCWRIGVPKRTGIGRAEFKAFFLDGLDPAHPTQASFQWRSSTILTPEQITEVRTQLDTDTFREQFEAEWLELGGTIYYNFSQENVSEDVNYIPGERIIVGCDFNVDPMCWVLGHFVNNERLLIFDELVLRNTNTPAALNHLYNRYGAMHGNNLWWFIGDASSRARKTSATRSDYLHIKNADNFVKQIFFPKRNPPLADRFANVNAALRNASGEVRVLINPRCKTLIRDLSTMSYVEGTSEPENYAGTDIGHMADAFGYAITRLMPIRFQRTVAPQILT